MRISDWSSDVCSSDLQILRALAGIEQRCLADRLGLGGVGMIEVIGLVLELLVHRLRQHDHLFEPPHRGPQIGALGVDRGIRSEEHTSELQSLMRISYAVFCLKNKTDLRMSQIY